MTLGKSDPGRSPKKQETQSSSGQILRLHFSEWAGARSIGGRSRPTAIGDASPGELRQLRRIPGGKPRIRSGRSRAAALGCVQPEALERGIGLGRGRHLDPQVPRHERPQAAQLLEDLLGGR